MNIQLLLNAKTYTQFYYAVTKRSPKKRSESALKTNTIQIRLNDYELEKLKAYADSHSWSVSHVIREYIRRLPKPKNNKDKHSD